MNLKERHFWLGFNVFPGIGAKRFDHLLQIFGSAQKAWQASKARLKKTKVPKPILEKFFVFRQKFDIWQEILRLEKKRIRFIILQDDEYPKNLRKIKAPPPLLYLKGKILPQDSLACAVIGTRKITPYGREATEKLVTGLAGYGFTIVSGLARGVDSVAHRIALGNRGRTLAVIGSGLDNIYPPEHRPLAEKIVSENLGAVISELALGVEPLRGHFPSRNRIISGLSLGVLVTEGATVSGTKITSKFALSQGRRVLAVPGPITSSFSEGPADLIKIGAKMVTKVEDVLEEIDLKKVEKVYPAPVGAEPCPAPTGAGVGKVERINFASKEEEQIWQILVEGGKHVDQIVQKSELSSPQVLSCLTEMELQGKVKSIGQGNYILT